MKILVDEMPKTTKECIFSGIEYEAPCGDNLYECIIMRDGYPRGRICPGVNNCTKLKVQIERPYFSNCC